MNVKYWTTKEYATLREMASSPVPIASQLHLLPGRSADAIRRTMTRLKLKKAVWTKDIAYEVVLRLLKKRDMHAKEIADSLNLSVQWVGPIIKELHQQERIHIADRVLTAECSRSRLWKFGPGEDMPPASKKRKYDKRRVKAEPKQPEPVQIRRDPFQEFFFGRAA